MRLKDYFKEGVAIPLGYSPASASIKPVHIANGLCRATLGEYYDPRILNHTLNRWAKRGAEERHPTAAVLEDAADAFGEFARPNNRHRLDELRQLLRGVLGADGAVFDKNENCSYTLTHRAHVTRDHNDWGTGAFLYNLLVADVGRGSSPVIELLRTLLDDASDEISAISFPLTKDEEPLVYEVDADEAPLALATKKSGQKERTFRSLVLRHLRDGFDTLAEFEEERGSKLHSLRRIVLLSTFGLFLHLTSRSLDYEDGRKARSLRPPMLLDFVQRGWTPIALASHATYNLACKNIDRMIFHGVREALAQEYGEQWTTKKVEAFISDVQLRGSTKTQDRTRKHFQEVFRSYAAGSAGIAEAFYLAVVDALLQDLSGTPFDFARALGVRGGLLAPRGQRAVKKRYAPSPELLEVLLATTVRIDEEVEIEELGDRWWRQFGIIVGARRGDTKELARWSILDATKIDLANNAEALREALIGIGYARQYADGVTVIRPAWGV